MLGLFRKKQQPKPKAPRPVFCREWIKGHGHRGHPCHGSIVFYPRKGQGVIAWCLRCGRPWRG